MTSAPMSPSIIEQNGPARTRVRSSTRTPARGLSARGTVSPLPHPLGEAAGDRVDPLPRVPGAPPEQPRPVHRTQVREIIDIVDGLDGHGGADFQTARLGPVAHRVRAAGEADDGDVQRRAKAL